MNRIAIIVRREEGVPHRCLHTRARWGTRRSAQTAALSLPHPAGAAGRSQRAGDRRNHGRRDWRHLRQLRHAPRLINRAGVDRRVRFPRQSGQYHCHRHTRPIRAPGALATVGPSASLPSIAGASDDSAPILELQPDGQLFVFNPASGATSQYDNLAGTPRAASNVYDVQTGASVNLSSQISLTDATFGDFGVYQNSLVVAAESNNWDFVMRLTYGTSGGVATVLVASPVTDGQPASPQGVAVDSTGMVLTTLPYVPAPSATAIDVPVGFNLFYDTGNDAPPFVAKLGLTSVPDIDSGGIAVDSQNNFLVTESTTSLYVGGPGVVHINSALTAFLAVPNADTEAILSAIAYQNVAGTDIWRSSTRIRIDRPRFGYVYHSDRLPLFSGQISPAKLRGAYGVDQISFTGPGGHHRHGRRLRPDDRDRRGRYRPHARRRSATFDQFFGIPAPPSFTGRGPGWCDHAG